MCAGTVKMKVAFMSGDDEPRARVLPLGDATMLDQPLAMFDRAPEPTTRRPRRRALQRVIGSVVLLVVSAVAGAVLFRPSRQGTLDTVIRWSQPVALGPTTAAPTRQPLEAGEPFPPGEPASDTVLLSVTVSPAEAQVFLDGQLLAAGSFTARLPRDGNSHRLAIRAVGFHTKERTVSLRDNAVFDLSLAPLLARRDGGRRPVRRSASPTLVPAPMRRPIERKNPYAEDTGAAPVGDSPTVAGR
jgi:hypothetical protein